MKPDAAVDCRGCTACCRSEVVILTPEDTTFPYDAHEIVNPLDGKPVMALRHKPDGSCVYLGESGCTIYAHRPKICLVFSCVGMVRKFVAEHSRAERRRAMRLGIIAGDVWEAGMARMREADAA